jgi:hypothetical protein
VVPGLLVPGHEDLCGVAEEEWMCFARGGNACVVSWLTTVSWMCVGGPRSFGATPA